MSGRIQQRVSIWEQKKISGLKDRTLPQSEGTKEKRLKMTKESLLNLWYTIKRIIFIHMEIQKEKRKEQKVYLKQ